MARTIRTELERKNKSPAVRGLEQLTQEGAMDREEMIQKTVDNLRTVYYEDLEFVYKMVEGLVNKKYRTK